MITIHKTAFSSYSNVTDISIKLPKINQCHFTQRNPGNSISLPFRKSIFLWFHNGGFLLIILCWRDVIESVIVVPSETFIWGGNLFYWLILQWRHNGHDSVSNHQPHDYLLNRFFQTQIKENIKAPRHWPLCGKFSGDGKFPAQMASNAENVSIWWRHHEDNQHCDYGIDNILYALMEEISSHSLTSKEVWLNHGLAKLWLKECMYKWLYEKITIWI